LVLSLLFLPRSHFIELTRLCRHPSIRTLLGKNFRFNQGILEMLSNVEMLGPSVRAAGEESFEMVVPPMKARNFNFSEVTKF
jgi:hypothetical protein